MRLVRLWMLPLWLVAVSNAPAGGGYGYDPMPQPWVNSAIDESDAASLASQATGGRVLSVRPQGKGGYSVKVLMPDGRVRVVHVDGRTGTVR